MKFKFHRPFIAVSLSLLALFSLRILFLSSPPTLYFDEPLRFQAVQELSLGLFPQDFHAHPPLSHLLMLVPFKIFMTASISQLPRPLPFSPKDIVSLKDQILLLSESGLSLYLLPFPNPSPYFLCSLPKRGEKLFQVSKEGKFAVFLPPSELWVMKGRKKICSLKVPSCPKGVVLLKGKGSEKLVVIFDKTLSAFSPSGQISWRKEVEGSIASFSWDEDRGTLALALNSPSPHLLIIDPEGSVAYSLPLPEKPTALSMLHQPSLVAPTKGWGRYILEVLFADGKRGRFAPNMGWRLFEVFPEPLRGLRATSESSTLFYLGQNTLYLFNSSTGFLEAIVPLKFSPKDVFPDEEGKRAFLVSDNGDIFVFSRTPPVLLCRLSPAFFGGVLLPFLSFLFCLRLTNSFPHSLLAIWLVGLDPLLFWLSRTLMLDIFVSTFSLSSFFFAFLSLSSRPSIRWFYLTITGILLGLSISSKLNGLFCFPLIFWLLSPVPLTSRLLYILLVPSVTYFFVWEIVRQVGGFSWGQIFHAHIVMLTFQSQLKEIHPTAAPFWLWILGKGSVLLFHRHLSDDFGVWMFLPLPFWLWIFGLVFVVKELKERRSDVLKDFPQVGFWGLWLFWALSPRPVHSYYFATSVPFLSVILAKNFPFKFRWLLLTFWILSFLWLSPTIYGLPLPLLEGHKLSHPLMGWLPYIFKLIQQR